MRILQIIKTNEGATWAFVQAKWLFDNGVDIITILPSINAGMAEKYRSHGMKVIALDFSLPIANPLKFFERKKSIKNIVEELNPDIIHCHFVTNIMMVRLALRKTKIPRLFQVPGPLHLENKLFKNVELILSEDNDFWAGACKKTCDIYLNSGISSDKVFLAYYGGYGGKTCDEYAASQGILHTEYGIPKDGILVGMVSYFYKPKRYLLQKKGIKGHEDFIKAIALVRKKYQSVVGIVIGDAWSDSHDYVEDIKKIAKDECNGGIIFTGFRNDMKMIYKELDIVVHPSHSENLGGAAESLAAAVPTISTNIGGFPDIVVDGETGYTIPPKSAKELADAIIKMIGNPVKAKTMGEKGQELVRQMLDINNTGKSVLDIYNRILKWRNY